MVHRRNRSPHLDQNLIQEILRILSYVAKNPYIHNFKILGQEGNIEEYKIELNTGISVDQRRFNAPAMD
jgi:ribosomal protein S8